MNGGAKNLSDAVQTVDGHRLAVGRKGFASDDGSVIEPVDDEQIQLCLRWFSQARTTPTPTLNSFWLKHVVENWAGTFVSNGAVIIAAHRAGIPIGRDGNNGNATIGVSTESVDEFDCGCGHP